MKITSSQVFTAFSKHPKYKRVPKNFVVSDGTYFCPRIETVQNVIYPAYKMWLLSCGLDKWTYQWDCDNFSDAFKVFSCAYHFQRMEDKISGIGIGVINYVSQGGNGKPKGRHAINIVYAQSPEMNEDGSEKFDLCFLEPQNGQLYDLSPQEFKSIYTIYI